MASLNKVFLMGNLTRDPELRYVPSGTAVATFTVAVNRVYTSQAGEKKEEVSFIRIVVWGRRAEVCGEYLSKGSPAFVEGRLQSRRRRERKCEGLGGSGITRNRAYAHTKDNAKVKRGALQKRKIRKAYTRCVVSTKRTSGERSDTVNNHSTSLRFYH